MPRYHMDICDHAHQTTGTIQMMSSGPGIELDACGPESTISLSGNVGATMQSGPAILSLTNTEGVTGQASLQAGELGVVKLGVGLPEIGSFVTLEPEMITLSVGVPGVGASIKMTPESITFAVGEITYTMTPGGIVEDVMECTRELTPEGHNFMAAETELNVGVAGQVSEAPTSEATAEVSAVIEATVLDQTAAAELTVDAAISMVT